MSGTARERPIMLPVILEKLKRLSQCAPHD